MFNVVTALRAVDGRNRAIYEHETQPMGPLMPRADVSTMIDYVDMGMRANATRNEQINLIINPQANGNISAGVSSYPNKITSTSAGVPRVVPRAVAPFNVAFVVVSLLGGLSTTGDANMLATARGFMYEFADEILARVVKIDRNGIRNLADYPLVRYNEHDRTDCVYNCASPKMGPPMLHFISFQNCKP